MNLRERLERLEAVRNYSPDALEALIRERLRDLRIGEPDPLDLGTQMLIESILGELRK